MLTSILHCKLCFILWSNSKVIIIVVIIIIVIIIIILQSTSRRRLNRPIFPLNFFKSITVIGNLIKIVFYFPIC